MGDEGWDSLEWAEANPHLLPNRPSSVDQLIELKLTAEEAPASAGPLATTAALREEDLELATLLTLPVDDDNLSARANTGWRAANDH